MNRRKTGIIRVRGLDRLDGLDGCAVKLAKAAKLSISLRGSSQYGQIEKDSSQKSNSFVKIKITVKSSLNS
jgi:hypothetical protein